MNPKRALSVSNVLSILSVLGGACLGGAAGCPAVARAQPAAPQSRTPWADSTHITGIAQKVMPELPSGSKGSEDPPPAPVALPPQSAQELLQRMDGAELYFREFFDHKGWGELPAWWRTVMRAGGAQVQQHDPSSGVWYTLCTLTPAQPRCDAVPLQGAPHMAHELSAWGLVIRHAACMRPFVGSASAQASYGWEHFYAGMGKFANLDRNLQARSNGYAGHWMQGGQYYFGCYMDWWSE